MVELSRSLKDLRLSCGVSQSLIAKAAGISTTQYQNYEYGKSEPTATVLVSLSKYFQVTTDYLLGLTDIPDIPERHVYPYFPIRLKQLRIDRGLTLFDISSLFEETERNYAGYEEGEMMPRLTLLCALADYFDVSLDYLVGRSDDPARH